MRIPLFVLAVGSVLADTRSSTSSPVTAPKLLRRVAGDRRQQHHPGGHHHVGEVVSALPTVFMAVGFAWRGFLRPPPEIPVELARQHVVLYRFLLNKWYFDEIYDFLIVRPTLWLGRLLWKGGDGWVIDGLGPTASRRGCSTSPQRGASATGYMNH